MGLFYKIYPLSKEISELINVLHYIRKPYLKIGWQLAQYQARLFGRFCVAHWAELVLQKKTQTVYSELREVFVSNS